MNFLQPIKNFIANITTLGYDAIKPTPRRKPVVVSKKSEDKELQQGDRDKMTSAARDIVRNLTIAGFAVRKHLLRVARFDFKCSIPNQPEYNDLVKRFIYNWSRRENCDVAGRHSLRQLVRLIETHRTLDGDVGIILTSQNQLQIVESDRIRQPPNVQMPGSASIRWENGVKVNSHLRALAYAVHRRTDNDFELEREVPAKFMLMCGYYSRVDQVRGVSPFAPAINQFRDVYENIDYALAKAKVSQLLGLVTQKEDDPEATAEENTADAMKISAKVEKWNPGVLHLDLMPGEDAKILTEGTPSNQFQDFMENVIRISLASLDIPYSFYDGSKTNYYGSRGALDDYIEEAGEKQIGLGDVLHEITDWRITNAILDGELPPPPNGMTIDQVLWYCDWIGARMPFWRLIEDSKGYHVAMQDGLISPQRVSSLHGLDYDETIAELSQANQISQKFQVQLAYNTPITTANIGV